MDRVNFTDPETNEVIEFFCLEQTTINGVNYLLVTEDEEGDSEAYILKESSTSEDGDTIYDMVEEDKELNAIGKVFAELMEDVDLEY